MLPRVSARSNPSHHSLRVLPPPTKVPQKRSHAAHTASGPRPRPRVRSAALLHTGGIPLYGRLNNNPSPEEIRNLTKAKFGTKNENPLFRWGHSPYQKCRFCGHIYTYLGITRHEDRCGETR